MEIIIILFVIIGIIGAIQSAIENSKVRAATKAAEDLLTSAENKSTLEQIEILKKSFHKKLPPQEWDDEIDYIKKVTIPAESTKNCPTCSVGYLVRRSGQYGQFYGCSAYPKCTHTQKNIKLARVTKTANPIFNISFKKDLSKAYKI